MTAIPIGVSNYVRTLAKTPPILLKNMFVEKDPTNLIDGLVRLPRPGLAQFTTGLDGIVRGIHREAGFIDGDYLVVAGAKLYSVDTSGDSSEIDDLPGDGRVIIAASGSRALIATGTICYSTDGATLTTITMPDSEDVSSVAYIDGYFILTVANSNRYFWLAPGDTNPDALNFASAENSPDNLVVCRRLLDELWFFGEKSLEVHQATGNSDAPFQRIGGRLFERGCVSAHAATVLDNTIFWIGDDLIVYRGDSGPVRISDHSIEETLGNNAGAELSMWAFSQQGHTFLVLRIGDAGTFVFDVENQNWQQWHDYASETWRAWCGAQNGSQVIAGDDTTGTLWRLDPERTNDNGDPIQRLLVGGVAVLGNPVVCNVVRIFCSTGWTTDVNAEPVMELNFDDTGTGLFDGPWFQISLGRQGEYDLITEARQLGPIYPPGRTFALRCSDDVKWRVSAMRMNED